METMSYRLTPQKKKRKKEKRRDYSSFDSLSCLLLKSLPTNVRSSPVLSSFKKNLNTIFSKNASLLVCKTPFLHSLTVEWMCGCRGGGVNMITDVLYSVNVYIRFCVTLAL